MKVTYALRSLGYSLYNKMPTRRTNSRATLIDHVFTNSCVSKLVTENIEHDLSDHNLVFVSVIDPGKVDDTTQSEPMSYTDLNMLNLYLKDHKFQSKSANMITLTSSSTWN